jgi:hypothetical protein
MGRVKRKTRSRLSLVVPKVEAARTSIKRLAGQRPGDELTAMILGNDALHRLGIYADDRAICLHTGEAQNGDLVWLEDDAGGNLVGLLRHAPGGYVRLERDGDTYTFKPGTARVMGRVVAVWRDGHFIDLPITIRPLTERK